MSIKNSTVSLKKKKLGGKPHNKERVSLIKNSRVSLIKKGKPRKE